MCDRFLDSTIAYQGRTIPEQNIRQIHKLTTSRFREGGFFPDLTFLLTLDPNESAKRILARHESNVFDNQSLSEFVKIQNNFLEIAKKVPDRVKTVSTDGAKEETFVKIQNIIDKAL